MTIFKIEFSLKIKILLETESMKPFLLITITALLLTSCTPTQKIITENIQPKAPYQNDESYAYLDNLTQTGLFQELGEVIIKDPIMGRNIYQTIDGDIVSTIARRNELRSLDYKNSGTWVNHGIVYPAFLELSLVEQFKFLEPLKKSNPKEIVIQFVNTGAINVTAFKASFQQLPKTPIINLEFYTIPANYYELFDVMDERLTKDSEISILIWIPDLPYGFSVDSFLLHAKAWINRHPNNLRIKSFWFSILNAPGMQFVLKNNPSIIFEDFPAKSVSIHPMGIDTRWEPPGDGPKWKAIIEQFFKNSKVENMYFDFGKKEWEKIEIYGY